MLSDKLTAEEKTAALKEATESTDWVYDAIKKICEDNENWEKTVRLSDEERADFFRNTDDRIKLNDIIVEKNFWSLLDKSEIFSDQYFRKIFNFRFYGERSDFDFCPILKIGRSWSGVWGFHQQAICTHIVRAKSMLATSCGGQLSATPFRTPFARKIVKIMELVEIWQKIKQRESS